MYACCATAVQARNILMGHAMEVSSLFVLTLELQSTPTPITEDEKSIYIYIKKIYDKQ